MWKVLVVSLILIATLAKQDQKKAAILEIMDLKVEPNTTKKFSLQSLNTSKAFMITVEDPDRKDFQPFTIKLKGQGIKPIQCQFKYANNLCVLSKPSKDIEIQVQCLRNGCNEKLVFSQRIFINTSLGGTFKKRLANPGEVYFIDKRETNGILQIFAQREQEELLSSDIKVYSNVHVFYLPQIEELDSNILIYGLKPIKRDADQYIYIENKSPKVQLVKAAIHFYKLQLDNQSQIQSFIENYGHHSASQYDYSGSFKKNIQVNVRVFAPREPKDIPLIFSLNGHNSSQQQFKTLVELKFNPIDFDGHSFYDFSFLVSNKIHQSTKFFMFKIGLGDIEQKAIFYQLQVRDVDVFEVNLFDHIFFASEANQTFQFNVLPQVTTNLKGGDQNVSIMIKKQDHYSSNIETCSIQKGCNIKIKTQDPCINCSFSFDFKENNIKNHIIYYSIENNEIQGKIDFQEEVYLTYKMTGAYTQIIVNSQNVILYANFEGYQRCTAPSAKCHQYAINQHNPIIVRNSGKDQDLLIKVVGLQKTTFKVRFLNQDTGIIVKMGEKFSYLMDNKEKQTEIKFVLDRQQFKGQNIHFNLISPLHSTRLSVSNQNGQTLKSLDGYVTFSKNNIQGNDFNIIVEKFNMYYDDYVHFTFIVTDSDLAIRLDSTSTHYEKYAPKAVKKFIIQYQPQRALAINIVTTGLEKSKSKMLLTISDLDESDGASKKPYVTSEIITDNDFLQLDELLEKTDACEDNNCQLVLSITSEADTHLEQSLTLMMSQSIIYLDDSIWGSYQINQFTKRNHFYFFPRHQNKSITLLFSSDDQTLSIDYRIYNTKNSISPQSWPFGASHQAYSSFFSGSQEMIIQGNDPELVACWPDCVVLINVKQARANSNYKAKQSDAIKVYKILATNSILELLQDTKLQFYLRNEQQKDIFISVSNLLSQEKLTFFTYYTFGRAKITATLFSHNTQYSLLQRGQFIFKQLETTIPIIYISQIISNNNLEIQSVLLKIKITAQTNLKMNIQYTSFLKDIYSLKMDELQVITLRENEQVWYEIQPQRDFSLKIFRTSGYPLFKLFKCEQHDYLNCFNSNKQLMEEQMKEFKQIGEVVKSNLEQEENKAQTVQKDIEVNEEIQQKKIGSDVLLDKSYEFNEEACQKCIFYLWIYCFEGDLEISLNLRSKNSEVELKEMKAYQQTANQGVHSRYLINTVHNKDTTIAFRVLSGEAEVTISDTSYTLFKQTLKEENADYKEYLIEADDDDDEDSDDSAQPKKQSQLYLDSNYRYQNLVPGVSSLSGGNKIFRHLQITVNTISNTPFQFIISYSVGMNGLFLQDGVIVEKNLSPDAPITYFYHNKNRKTKVYLTLSSELNEQYDQQDKNKQPSVIFYYYPDASDRSLKETFMPQLPPEKNQNYLSSTITNVYQLPSQYELYEVQIVSHAYSSLFVSINHQELVYLPYGFQYIINLEKQQALNLVVDNPMTEYLQVKVKQCRLGYPTLQFTNNAAEFKKGLFEGEVDIDKSIFKHFIKTKKDSNTIHFKLTAPSDSESLLTISVAAISKQGKAKKQKLKAGNNGLITYNIIDTKTAEITLKPVLCNMKKCTLAPTYYLILSSNIESILEEINCAGTRMISGASQFFKEQKSKVIILDENTYDSVKDEYRYKINFSQNQKFVAAKAIVPSPQGISDEIQYIPVEILTLWDSFSATSSGFAFFFALFLLLTFCIVAVISTKMARRGYKPVSGIQ